jgi:hypothetical protein
VPTLVGIDHGFSFPLRYFEVHRLKPDWSAFLDDFQRHWPTDENIYVDCVRDGTVGNGSAREPRDSILWWRFPCCSASSGAYGLPGLLSFSSYAGLGGGFSRRR